MLRFIWDKVRKLLPVALMMIAMGIVFYAMMKHAGEDAAALLGLFDIGVGLLLIGMMLFSAVRDLVRWRRELGVAAALDDYLDAEQVHPNARLGKDRVFFNMVSLAYWEIRTMYCTHEYTTSNRGYVTWWYILYAERTDGKRFRALLVEEKKGQDGKAQATAVFTRIMDEVKSKNPGAQLRYPSF